mmetsp:Transcript_17822/g.32883  ORF Transcript_17822/g.32883 Transcript_17822/m.32883 type:complete len:348 (-) Transcript_17822:69-1112(-)|eukprot:CAMPEP_0184511720 /NCGR_PEP_ID=MMETSP0198_2-20121128/2501_1 /TAXON_ID=1112570 /ORGANISM="Thraustochytrium sp., Strain LLF1b" /LENGTH=347 /DNA_ID=CAMNT_0026901703 /DNA_START=219 /DNA_END=1262 /DNA_ORIENTATION=-
MSVLEAGDESCKPSTLGATVIVTDGKTLDVLFAHRLVSSAYSKAFNNLNPRKRVVHEVRRKRPRLDLVQGKATEEKAVENVAEDNKDVETDQGAANQSTIGGGNASSPKAEVIAPGDHRASLRTQLDQPVQEDRPDVDEYVANVALPLRLMPEETRIALDQNLIALESRTNGLWVASAKEGASLGDASDWKYPSNRAEELSWRTFAELWKRGWIVTKGTNFGCDFLLYTSDPGTTHSTFAVVVTDINEEHVRSHPTKWTAITALATKVRKTALLACVEDDEARTVHFTLVEGCLFRRTDYQKGKALEEAALKEEEAAARLRFRRENPLQALEDGQDDDFGEEVSVAV